MKNKEKYLDKSTINNSKTKELLELKDMLLGRKEFSHRVHSHLAS